LKTNFSFLAGKHFWPEFFFFFLSENIIWRENIFSRKFFLARKYYLAGKHFLAGKYYLAGKHYLARNSHDCFGSKGANKTKPSTYIEIIVRA
jgi:hypothetical protein